MHIHCCCDSSLCVLDSQAQCDVFKRRPSEPNHLANKCLHSISIIAAVVMVVVDGGGGTAIKKMEKMRSQWPFVIVISTMISIIPNQLTNSFHTHTHTHASGWWNSLIGLTITQAVAIAISSDWSLKITIFFLFSPLIVCSVWVRYTLTRATPHPSDPPLPPTRDTRGSMRASPRKRIQTTDTHVKYLSSFL